MRKLIPLLVAVLVVAMAAPVGAKRVVNERYSQYEIQAWDENGGDNSAVAFAGDQGSGFWLNWYADFACDEFSNPFDLAWRSVSGYGDLDSLAVSPTKGRDKFFDGSAAGYFSEGQFGEGYCDGSEEWWGLTTFGITMDGSDGSLVKTSGGDSWHIPGETNQHTNQRGTMRMAVGDVFFGVEGLFDFAIQASGANGEVSWSSHENTN